jgi:uncharacterized protein YukE
MADQIKITYNSLDEAVEALRRLMARLNDHTMYTGALSKSQGQTLVAVGELSDEMNQLKSTLGRLIDGTMIAFRETSAAFAEADARIAQSIGQS